MLSKTKLIKRTENKRNPEVVETIKLLKEKDLELAKKISGPKSNYTQINLTELNKIKEDKILVTGKVLGEGELESKKTIIALSFSNSAKEKLKKAGCEVKSIKEFILKNELKGVKIL